MENINNNTLNTHNPNEINSNENNNAAKFYHNEIVDVFDFEKKISSEAIITSIRGNVYAIKDTSTNEEEIIRHNNKILISQCKKRIKNF